MSDNATSADNQQGSPLIIDHDPSETTRRSPVSQDIAIAYLQGALHDATKGRGKRVRFTQKYPAWLDTLSTLLAVCEERSWKYKEGKTRDVYALETTAPFLDFNFDIQGCVDVASSKAYIRGFFDAEGGVPHKCNSRMYIQFVQKDKPKLLRIRQVLQSLGIGCGVIHNPSKMVDPEYWRFYISTSSHQDFIQLIGSWHPVKAKILKDRMVI